MTMPVSDVVQGIVGSVAGLTALFIALHKFNLLRITDKTSAAAADALTKQFEILRTSLETMKTDQEALKLLVGSMDKKIHQQQRTITRMEMLLRQFSGLVQEHGIQVPQFMQDELRDLIEDVDSPMYSKR